MDFLTSIAEWCMPFLYFLRDIGNPVFDFFFETVTHLGEETVFLVISIIFFWCVNKREGYFILLSGLLGTLINQAAKLACRVPRPWVIDTEFQPIGNSKIEATGYSFPSGHTQNTATTFGCIAAYNRKKRWVTVMSVVIIVLVSFSRMYLGVHTPLDVITSLLVSLGLILILRPWFETEEKFDKAYPIIVVISVICSFAFLAFVLFVSKDASLDAENYKSALKNACTLLGCTVGLVVVWVVDTMFVNFDTKAPWYAQIIKAVLGFAIVLLIKSGLSAPLTALFGNEYVARIIRYFLIVVFAGAVWPLTFKKFGEMKISALDNFSAKIKSKFTKKA
ncbi:MAG: phosphatase PAP2 family protein [Clostridia bacterium]|nr:phosphatase PAP2 family protein [Clostridia bacterium]